MTCRKCRHYIWDAGCSGAECDGKDCVDAQALGDNDAEPLEKHGLELIGLRHAAQADLPVRESR